MGEFKKKLTVYMGDTDATGGIYFTSPLKWALETFETFVKSEGISLQEMLLKSNLLLPIVHAEADFFLPLKVGDDIEISLHLQNLNKNSFVLTACIFHQGKEAGKCCIVHVTVDKKTGKSTLIPLNWVEILKKLSHQEF